MSLENRSCSLVTSCVVPAILALIAAPCFAEQTAAITARIRHPVHPVLIRKNQNPVLKVTVDVGPHTNVDLKSLAVTLSGSDIERDLESVQLLSSAGKPAFADAKLLKTIPVTAKSMTFESDQRLSAGSNVFWISVRLNPTANLTHFLEAKCHSIETSAGSVVPLDETDRFRHRIGMALRQHQDDGVHTYRIPVLATSRMGTLLCAYDMRRRAQRDLQEDIDIGLSRSTDGGQSWEPMTTIMDMGEYNGLPQEQNGCSDPGIIVDRQTGEIFVFALWVCGKPGKHQWVDDGSEAGFEIGKTAQFLMVRSDDDGKTWSKPVNLTRKLKQEAWWLLAPSPQQGINLTDGTLVMPVQGRDKQGVPFATVMVSRDHGNSWSVGDTAYLKGNECQAALLDDGSIMLNIRNDIDRFRAVYTTSDLGKTWAAHPTNRKALIEPNCNASLFRLDDVANGNKQHVLLFSNPHSQQGRTHQTIQVSFDDGMTWPSSHHLLLDEGRGAGYSSLTRIDAETVGIIYEGSQAQLVFEKIPLSELLTPR